MTHNVGIDLGTTNSAICSFDGDSVRLYKSPEQHDVTPSALYINRRSKYVGARAYDNAARDPDNAAVLFKRMMGSNTPIKLTATSTTLSPVDCSAEILKTLYAYLPEEIRSDVETGVVITVPAAFNQMQKDATHSAAEGAGIGKVALMQEPVAAVMSVMRQRRGDGRFLVYDLGGGTLDIAIAESASGRVNLLSHAGIEMCGGRDFDRLLFENIVKPWLLDKFDLPEDLAKHSDYRRLVTLGTWAAEKAKIGLSNGNESIINLSETELGMRDQGGQELYLDIPLTRSLLDDLIAATIEESLKPAFEALKKAGLGKNDIDRVVFVGGPTQYKPLRDKVAAALGIAASTDVNPMTAVAEGAAVFAESIDWSSESRGRKRARGSIAAGSALNVAFNFVARTPDTKAKIVAKVTGTLLPGAEYQVDSPDTGWSSGKVKLLDGAAVEVPLPKAGDNQFKIWVFDATGAPIPIAESRLTIARTAATIEAIPASSSIAIEVLDKVNGRSVPLYLVRDGDALPKKGQFVLRAQESVRAGSAGSLNIKIWEGEIESPVRDNRFVGVLRIRGTDFDEGSIKEGDELRCDFEVLDSGNIVLEVTVPSIGGTFHSGHNFYSRQPAETDYSNAAHQILEDAAKVRERLAAIAENVDSAKLDQAFEKLDAAESIVPSESDRETAKKAMDNVGDAKKLLAQIRKEHLKQIRKIDFDSCVAFFNTSVREHARPAEIATFENLARTAQRAIDKDSVDFENLLDEMRGKNFQVLWRQDWFVINRFKWLSTSPHLFPDPQQLAQGVAEGNSALKADDMGKLREVVWKLDGLRVRSGGDDQVLATVNVIGG